MRRIFRRSAPLVTAALAGLAVLLPAAPAQAQFGDSAQIGRVMAPYYLRRDVRLIVDELQLDEGQADILEALFFDYEAAHKEARDGMEDRFRGMKDEMAGIDPSDKNAVLALVMSPFVEQAGVWYSARQEFLDNIQVILTPSQMAQWDPCMRALRRSKELPMGSLSGEGQDLYAILRLADLQPAASGPLAEALTAYELELDAALLRRQRVEEENREDFMQSMAAPDAGSVEMVRAMTQARVAVRDVNLRTVEILASMLPAADGERLRQAFRVEAFTAAARPTTASRILDAAPEVESINADQLARVQALRAEYAAALPVLVDRQRVAMIRYEPTIEIDRALQFVNDTSGPIEGEMVLSELRRERTDFDRNYMRRLQGILTKSQFLQLPGASRFVARGGALRSDPIAGNDSNKRRDGDAGRRGVGSSGGGR